MKILYAVEAVNLSGGYDRVIIEKANYLAEHGFDVIITVASHALAEPCYEISEKVRLIDFGIDFHQQYGHHLFYRAFIYFVMMRRYRRALKELLFFERPDIVITTLGREIDFITKIHDGSVKIGESHIAKNYVRNLHLMEQNGFVHQMIARYWRWKMDKLVKQLDALVLLTQHDADSWNGLTKTVVIPNSLPFFPEKPSTCNQKQVIFVGRLNEQKGLEYLIETWERVHQKHKDWILQIYGDGEQRELLLHLISEAKLKDAVVVNHSTRQIMDKYLESSIFLLTSRFEGFGMVLIEAMACGVPVVSFDCPWGPADIIKNGEDGFLVEYLNTTEAAEKVVQLIESPELRMKMGIRARENVQRYSRNTVMKQWIELFYSLCNYGSL
jgi:glycosyltransferase involved in cell wall biosynthesis